MKKTALITIFCAFTIVSAAQTVTDSIDASRIVEHRVITATSVPVVSRNKIQQAPALFGQPDVLKYLQYLPGITSGNEGDVGIRVRGGDYDQNLMLLDGVPIFNPSHLQGFVSSFDSDIFERSVLHKQMFPASHGSRLSSVLEVQTKDGLDRWSGAVNVGIVYSGISISGPLIKDKLGVTASFRKSYTQYLLFPIVNKLFPDNSSRLDKFSDMDFTDMNFSMKWKPNLRDAVRFTAYCGKDRIDRLVTDSVMKNFQDTAKNVHHRVDYGITGSEESWRNMAFGLTWTHDGPFPLKAYAYYSGYRQDGANVEERFKRIYAFPENGQEELYKLKEIEWSKDSKGITSTSIEEMAAGADWHLANGRLLDFTTGAKISYTSLLSSDLSSYLSRTGTNPLRDTIGVNYPGRLMTYAAYAENKFQISDRFFLSTGLRFSCYQTEERAYPILEPRIKAVYDMEHFELRASYTRMSQAIHLLSVSSLTAPSDMWVGTCGEVSPMTSSQYSIGTSFAHEKTSIHVSAEAYWKSMNNMAELLPGASYSRSDDWTTLVDDVKGWAYGTELQAEKREGNTTWSAAYTWSKSMRRGISINSGRPYYASNDTRHNLTLMASQSVGKHIDLSAVFTCRSGRRATMAHYRSQVAKFVEDINNYNYKALGQLYLNRLDNLPKFEQYELVMSYIDKNDVIFPLYHRMDLSASYKIFHKFGKSVITLSVYNLYNRMNPYAAYINSSNEISTLCLFPIMPSIGYRFEF